MYEEGGMNKIGEGERIEKELDELTLGAAAGFSFLACSSWKDCLISYQVQGLSPSSVHVSIRWGHLRCKRSDGQWTIRAS